ncbi:hypothetical protein FOI42_RS03700 [Escherichia coli]|nr:hypothetical protein [Escherichia coli]MED6699416.1 hypothetical protein [Escherichia coli O157]
MHDMIDSALTEFNFFKKSLDTIINDTNQQMKDHLSDKLVGRWVELPYIDGTTVGVIHRIVTIHEVKVYVEILVDNETNKCFVQLSTEDLTFL